MGVPREELGSTWERVERVPNARHTRTHSGRLLVEYNILHRYIQQCDMQSSKPQVKRMNRCARELSHYSQVKGFLLIYSSQLARSKPVEIGEDVVAFGALQRLQFTALCMQAKQRGKELA